MTLVYSFLFCGFICLIGQIILDNTNFTPGHITTIFVVLGSVLGVCSFYDKIVKVVGAGANIPIMSFGNLLLNGSYSGYLEDGLLGLFSGILVPVSAGIVSAIVFAFIMTLFFKAQD
ncbi:MAG: SpoVA/SpoVAEb family sporulation membrane protein [Mollicutes bacterium]|jgi:stage V sporulation protein AE|nr:SpoVA/SpoVAEb family sporulation membrane protein [Mollicutes bacterium]